MVSSSPPASRSEPPDSGGVLQRRDSEDHSAVLYSAGETAAAMYFADLSRTAMSAQAERTSRLKFLRRWERILFPAAAATACFAPLLVLGGIVLGVAGVASGGILLTAAGLLGGAAGAGIFRLRRETAKELTQLGKEQQKDVRLYQALIVAQAISDIDTRTRAVAEISGAILASPPPVTAVTGSSGG